MKERKYIKNSKKKTENWSSNTIIFYKTFSIKENKKSKKPNPIQIFGIEFYPTIK